MWQHVGVVRDGKALQQVVPELRALQSQLPASGDRRAHEAANILAGWIADRTLGTGARRKPRRPLPSRSSPAGTTPSTGSTPSSAATTSASSAALGLARNRHSIAIRLRMPKSYRFHAAVGFFGKISDSTIETVSTSGHRHQCEIPSVYRRNPTASIFKPIRIRITDKPVVQQVEAIEHARPARRTANAVPESRTRSRCRR